MKQCLACKEDIKEDALKCKYCLQIQTRAANLHNRPAFSYLAIALLGFFILWLTYYIISFSMEEPEEPIFEIPQSTLHISQTDKGLNIRCIGQINNPYPKRWSNFSLQARFISHNSQVIDIHYSEPDVTIYPLFHFEGIVAGIANAAQNEYKSCKLSVISANGY